jgi:uncharacterized oligopeptide transporter (OPT) family protein
MTNSQSDQPGFTLRAVLIAITLSLFLLMSTSYIAIKLGAAPWPIIFSVIVSMAIIKTLNRRREINIHEINVAQAGGSIGGLVAAGIIFTVPGILFLNSFKGYSIALPEPGYLGLLIAGAGVLGIILSVPLKYTFIDEEELPFPAGTAGAELLKLGISGGKSLFLLVILGSIIAVFTLVRDIYLPNGLMISALGSLGILLPLLPLPIAIGAGFILGPRPGFSWLSGAGIGWLLIVPILFLTGTDLDLAGNYMQSLGMGMVLGAGVTFFLTYIFPRFRRIFQPLFSGNKKIKYALPWILLAGLLSLLLNSVPLFASLLTLAGLWAMVAVAARMTGETNIDPLEQFGIFVTVLIAMFYQALSLSLPLYSLFMIATFVSVACAISGDAGHDYKSAAIVGTRFYDIVKIDLITVIVSGFAAPFVFEIIREAFSGILFTPAMPAPQARLVAGSIIGFEHPMIFLTGFTIAFVGEIANKFFAEKYKNRLLWMPFGIGLFLGLGLALPIAIGSMIRLRMDKKYPAYYHSGILIAAGIMGAEGIAGFSAGALTISGLSFTISSMILAIFFVILFIIGIVTYIYKYSGLNR